MKQKLQIITKIFILTGMLSSIMVSPFSSIAQPKMKIGDYYGCSNTEILLAVELSNFEDIAAFTIYIGIDTAIIEYIGIENVNSVFASGSFVEGVNLTDQYITFNWISLTPASLEQGLLCNIRVLLKGNSIDLNFRDNCEIVRSDLSIVDNVEYINGSVAALNSIEPNPLYQSLFENSSATIELVNLPDDISCQWQFSSGDQWLDLTDELPFSGVNTPNLSIQTVSESMSNSFYRCMLANSICSEASEISELVVTTSGINEPVKSDLFEVYPNPVSNYANFIFNQNLHDAVLILTSLDGKVLVNKHFNNIISGQNYSLNMENINSGIYIVSLLSNGKLFSNLKITKL